MKKRFSAEQIIKILREGEGAEKPREVCARHNICEQTYYRWKRTYGGMEVDEVKQAKALKEENARLKRVVADQAVQIQILQEVNSKKW
jgi:putative transposase